MDEGTVRMAEAMASARVESRVARIAHDRPIPRVTIHVHVMTPETRSVIEEVSADRRFSKAHITVFEGGIEGAAQHYTEAPTPSLMLVEDMSPAHKIFGHLQALANVCDPGSKVMVIGRENDVAFYRDLMRQGVNEYLVGPLSVMQVIDAITALYIDPSAPPVGRVFAFTAARGGAGSSTVAHNIGWCIAEELDEDVTLVDLDLPFGTAGLDFNQDSLQGVADALSSPERLDDTMLERLLLKCTDHLSLFSAPGTLERELDLDPAGCERVIDVVRQSVPCVIMDLPHLWSPWKRHLMVAADEVIITATPDLSSLRNTKNFIDLLKLARPNDVPPRVVLNQVGVPKRPEITGKDFAEAIGLDIAATIAFEPQLFGTASNNGQMIPELSPHSRVSQAIRELARVLTGREGPVVKTDPLRAALDQLKAKLGAR